MDREAESAPRSRDPRGRDADRPQEIPSRGWRDIVARVRHEVKEDDVTLLSAGVAFYGLLSLVPGLIALISLYGLVADPDTVRTQVEDALSAAPSEVRTMVGEQLSSIAGGRSGTAVTALVIGVLLALWSASSAVGNVIAALNVAYEEEEGRGWVRRKLLSLGLTLGAILFLVVAFALISFLPSVLSSLEVGAVGRWVIGAVRWVLLFGGVLVGLSVLYRYGPDRDEPRWRWVSVGSVLAAALWLVGSALFSVYASRFGSYNETYGSLSAVIVVMLWLWITALSVILGAEVNSEIEHQTAVDSTVGAPRPMGRRDATVADTLGATAEEMSARP